MALTAKPISTIAYNTPDFLKRKIEALFNANKIVDYRYIFHTGENGDKDHFHVLLFPNRRIDTGELRLEFQEIDFAHPDRPPLGTMPWRASLIDHWLMYVLHDEDYLKARHADDGDGKIPYDLEDITTPFPEQLKRDYKTALRLRKTDNQKILDALNSGLSRTQMLYDLDINPMRLNAIDKALSEQRTPHVNVGRYAYIPYKSPVPGFSNGSAYSFDEVTDMQHDAQVIGQMVDEYLEDDANRRLGFGKQFSIMDELLTPEEVEDVIADIKPKR